MGKHRALHYLDNASTTRVAPAVADVVDDTLRNMWANPSALYSAGYDAEHCINQARTQLAKAMGCRSKEVVFTGCGTEANNIALQGAARARGDWAGHLVCSGYEHPSVYRPLEMLAQQQGLALTQVPPDSGGLLDIQAVADAVTEKTAVVAVMHVNNETGAVADVETLAAAVKRKNPRCFVHVDGVQGFCKLPLVMAKTEIDSYATSGHKLHAPKGVGALYLRSGSNLTPPLAGGGQEGGLRSGTENTAFIAGYAMAVQLAAENRAAGWARVQGLRARLLQGLAAMQDVQVHSPENGSPYITIFSMPKGLRSQVMLNLLDERYGVYLSSGSACSGGAASHTLAAMQLPGHQIDAALRVGLCADNTEEDIDVLLEGLADCVKSLARR